jgi:hypothetical protein
MFRFTIRDVLWLTVVVGMGLGWAATARRMEVYARTADSLYVILESEVPNWRELAKRSGSPLQPPRFLEP